jgi:hypothetical protein
LTPQGDPFFSIGLNHIDWATLCYPENAEIWRDKYGNNVRRWLTESVRPDLLAWGFNSVGWVQEVVTRTPTHHRHSRNFTFEEYQYLDMPYCHMLPFADFHQWEAETRLPDLLSTDFEEWCDYVARAHCTRFADDPKLIGYFYVDCPTWVHVREHNAWRGPLFDLARLESEEGKQELFSLARRYYQVAHDAIRRYDRHHLILGDRYEANAPLPEQVVLAAKGLVDVLGFQHFGIPQAVRDDLAGWAGKAGMPVLIADHADLVRIPGDCWRENPSSYPELLQLLRGLPACVGFHLCGAYLRNRCRRWGLRDERENPDVDLLKVITEANAQTERWVQEFVSR